MPKRKTHDQFLKDLYNINKDVEVLGTYQNANERIDFKCLKCSGIWNQKPNKLLSGCGCPYCGISSRKILVGVNDLWTTNSNIARLLMNPKDGYKYSKGSAVKVDWKCSQCNLIIKKRSIYNVVNRGKIPCPLCSDGISYPNRIMFSLLNQLNIDFETEKSFSWSRLDIDNKFSKARYDFYFKIGNKKFIVEMDGNWHNIDNNLSGQTKEKSKMIDKIKDVLAEQHDIKLIRIDSKESTFEYIRNNIIHSYLSFIFDLSNVDWVKCHQESSRSYKIDASKMWNNGLTTGEISKIMKKDVTTIQQWLKDCTDIGICNYSTNDGRKRARQKQGSPNSSSVYCIETNQCYNSIYSASIATNIDRNSISMCCRKIRNTAGKLHWEYAS